MNIHPSLRPYSFYSDQYQKTCKFYWHRRLIIAIAIGNLKYRLPSQKSWVGEILCRNFVCGVRMEKFGRCSKSLKEDPLCAREPIQPASIVRQSPQMSSSVVREIALR